MVTEDSQIRRYLYALNFWAILAMFAIFSIDTGRELPGALTSGFYFKLMLAMFDIFPANILLMLA